MVYRMRGLLGDATEDMVESLDSGGNKGEDEEQVYQMAAVLAKCGGIEAMLSRCVLLNSVDISTILSQLFSLQVVSCKEPPSRIPVGLSDTEVVGLLLQVESEPSVCHPASPEHPQLSTDYSE